MASPDSDVNSLSSSSSSSSSSAASPANNDVLNGYLKLPNHFVDEGYSNYDDDGSSQESNTKQSETSNSEDSNSSGNDATNAVTSNDNNYATIPPSTTTDISYSYYQQPDRQMYSDLVYANLTNSAPQFQQQQQQQPQQMIQPHMSMDFLRFYYPQYYPHAAPPPPPPPHHLHPLPPQSLPGSVYSYGMDPMMMRPMENTWVNKETSGEMNNKEEEEGETTANEEENDENDSVSTTSSSNTGTSNHLRNIQPRPPAQQQKPTPQPPQQQHQTGINVPDAEILAAAVNSKAKARSNAGVGGSRNTKRQRTKFDQHQIELLEAAFNLTHYPDTNQVDRMSTALGLSIERISIWFQNRRAKFKKSAKTGGATQQQQPPKVSAEKAPLSIRTNLEIQKTPSYNQTCQATTSSSGMMNQSVTNSCSSLSVTSSPVSNDSSSNSPPPKQSDPQSTSKHHHHQENEEESSDDSSQEDVAAAAAETRTSGERDAFNMASSLYGNAANLYRPHETYVYPQPQTQSTPSLFQPYMMDKEEPLSPQRHSLHLPMHNPNHLFVYHPQQFVPPPPQQPHFYPQYFPANTASTNLNQ